MVRVCLCVREITFSADIKVRGAGFGMMATTGVMDGDGVTEQDMGRVIFVLPSELLTCVSLTVDCLGFSVTASLKKTEEKVMLDI